MVMITLYGGSIVTDQWECSLGERHFIAVSFKSNDQTSKRSCSKAVLFHRILCLYFFVSLLRITVRLFQGHLKALVYENGCIC